MQDAVPVEDRDALETVGKKPRKLLNFFRKGACIIPSAADITIKSLVERRNGSQRVEVTGSGKQAQEGGSGHGARFGEMIPEGLKRLFAKPQLSSFVVYRALSAEWCWDLDSISGRDANAWLRGLLEAAA